MVREERTRLGDATPDRLHLVKAGHDNRKLDPDRH
jgi:hypothetical protein